MARLASGTQTKGNTVASLSALAPFAPPWPNPPNELWSMSLEGLLLPPGPADLGGKAALLPDPRFGLLLPPLPTPRPLPYSVRAASMEARNLAALPAAPLPVPLPGERLPLPLPSAVMLCLSILWEMRCCATLCVCPYCCPSASPAARCREKGEGEKGMGACAPGGAANERDLVCWRSHSRIRLLLLLLLLLLCPSAVCRSALWAGCWLLLLAVRTRVNEFGVLSCSAYDTGSNQLLYEWSCLERCSSSGLDASPQAVYGLSQDNPHSQTESCFNQRSSTLSTQRNERGRVATWQRQSDWLGRQTIS